MAHERDTPTHRTITGTLRDAWRQITGWTLITAVGLGALILHFRRSSPIAPTPLYEKTIYQLHTLIDGRPLTADGTLSRYGLPISGVTPLTPEGLRAIIRNRESRTPANAPVYVRLHTRENGGNEIIWLWPES